MRFLLLLTSLLVSSLSFAANLPAGVIGDSQVWRKSQDSREYVIQMISVKDVKYFPSAADIRAIKATSSGRDLVLHVKQVKGVSWNTLIWGPFSSRGEALATYAKLPTKLQKSEPWVRSIGSLEKPAARPVAEVAPKPVVRAPAAVPTPAVKPKPAPKLAANRPTAQRPAPRAASTPVRKRPSIEDVKYVDPYEIIPVDASSWDGAMAAQGTYPYVKVSVGELTMETDQLTEALEDQGVVSNFDDDFSDSIYELALGLDIGYYLGVELGYVDASALEPDSNIPTGSGAPALADNIQAFAPYGFTALKASALVKMPFHGSEIKRQWQPYAQVGLFDWEIEKDAIKAGGVEVASKKTEEDTDLFYAVGLDYKLTRHYALGLKYTVYDFDDGDDNGAVTADFSWRWEGRN